MTFLLKQICCNQNGNFSSVIEPCLGFIYSSSKIFYLPVDHWSSVIMKYNAHAILRISLINSKPDIPATPLWLQIARVWVCFKRLQSSPTHAYCNRVEICKICTLRVYARHGIQLHSIWLEPLPLQRLSMVFSLEKCTTGVYAARQSLPPPQPYRRGRVFYTIRYIRHTNGIHISSNNLSPLTVLFSVSVSV